MMSGMMFEYVDATAPPLRCPTCLTPGRVLHPMHDASRAYSTLLAGLHSYDQIMDFVSTARICWECHSFLSKMVKFQRQVFDADSMMRSGIAMGKCEVPTFSRLNSSATQLGYTLELRHEGGDEEGPEPWELPHDDDEVKIEYEGAARPDAVAVDEKKKRKKKKEGKKARAKREREKKEKEKVKKSKWPGKKVLLTGDNKNVKIVSVAVSEDEFQRYRDEDRKKKQYVNAPHKCETCIKGFACVAMLEKHIANCHSNANGTFECPVCGMHFRTQKLMMRHRRGHYRLYVCSVCGFPHRHLTKVLRHYHAAHEPGKTFPCALCGRAFQTRPSLVYHRRCEHRERSKCEHCGDTFRNQTTYKRHLLIHTGMPTYECKLCRRSYRGKFGYLTHMKTHGPPPRDAYCVECDVQFKHAFQYRRHLKISPRHASDAAASAGGDDAAAPARQHLANKYPCTACEKKFVSPSVLKRHYDSVHLKLKRYGCQQCDKNYATPAALWTHRKLQHERVVPPRDKVCEVCGKGFRSNTSLVDHMRSHTGERPFSCDACAATFRHNSGLYMHKRLVHNMRKKRTPGEGEPAESFRTDLPLGCRACPATFRHTSGLYMHGRLVHGLHGARDKRLGAVGV